MGRSVALLLLALVIFTPIAAAAPDTTTTRFLVSFDEVAPETGALLQGARVLESFPFARVALLEGPVSAKHALARLPGVAGVYDEEPVTLSMERERSIVDADPPARAVWPTGANVTVAIVDSGIDASHPAFQGRVSAAVRISRQGLVSSDAGDADGHGTHVAGIVAGDGAGSEHARQRGIAPGARLVGIDISDSFTTTNAVRAFAWIAENAQAYNIRVVSNSWGREKDDAHYDPNDPVIRASDALVDGGLVVVFSAGNRGRDGGATLTSEASNPRIVTVGAASGAGRPDSYSSRGPPVDGQGRALAWTKPDVVAPGTAVVSTRASVLAVSDPRTEEERYYTVMNGTSMAAPQVAAAAALLLDVDPSLSPAQVLQLLQESAVDLGMIGPDMDTGFGMLDVAAALQKARFRSGGERIEIIETLKPVRAEGNIGAALGAIVLAGDAPALPPAAVLTIPLVLPAGAVSVDLWFNWSGQGAFDARLLGPDGTLVFERIGGQSLHLAAPASPGAWRVDVSAASPIGYAPYALAGSITVHEERVVSVAAEAHGRPTWSGTGIVAQSSGVLAPLEIVAQAPFLVLALAGITATGVALRLKKK